MPSKSSQEAFFRVVRMLTERARGRAVRGHAIGELLDDVAWSRLLEQARATPPAAELREDNRRDDRPGFSRQDRASEGAAADLIARAYDRVEQADALNLGVHRAPGIGENQDRVIAASRDLPSYLVRPHDHLLRAPMRRATDPAAPESILVVLTGDSTVGKSRALWEAVRTCLPSWRLLAPADSAELAGMLCNGEIAPGTVLWLDELQRHLDGTDGPAAAGLLDRLLAGTPRVAVVGAMWTRPYWDKFTSQGRSRDIYAAARHLLTGSRTIRVNVPDKLDEDQLADFAALADGDERISAAVAAGESDGRVIQHLTGGPELLRGFQDDLFTPVEKALITAAVDARRLGHTGPLPAGLLTAAADAYLRPQDRPDQPAVIQAALDGLATGHRADGTRTDVRHTVRALTALRERTGASPRYEPYDYLQQHISQRGTGRIPPALFWDAVVEHAEPAELGSLADSARTRGLLRHAARLLKRAILHGSSTAASMLLFDLDLADAADQRAAYWSVDHVDVNYGTVYLLRLLHGAGMEGPMTVLADRAARCWPLHDPQGVAELLKLLREVGADRQAGLLLDRDPAAHIQIRSLGFPPGLLDKLKEAAGDRMVTALADRVTAETPIENLSLVWSMLTALREGGAVEQAVTLARRVITTVRPDDPAEALGLLKGLPEGEADLLARAVLDWAPAARLRLENPRRLSLLLEILGDTGTGTQVKALLDRAHLAEVSLSDPHGVAGLLVTLLDLGAGQQAGVLLDRDPAVHVPQDALSDTYRLLEVLHRAGAEHQVNVLADRIAAHVPLDDPSLVASLMSAMSDADASRQVMVLANRVAAHLRVSSADDMSYLLTTLYEAGANQQSAALLARHLPDHLPLGNGAKAARLLETLHRVGAKQHAVALAGYIAGHFPLDWPGDVAFLLRELKESGAERQASALADRVVTDAPTDRAIDDAMGGRTHVGTLLIALEEVGGRQQVISVAKRAAADMPLLTPPDVAFVLRTLREADASEHLTLLADRVADGVSLDFVGRVADFLKALHDAGADYQMFRLADRVADDAPLDSPSTTEHLHPVPYLLEVLTDIGAEAQATRLAGRVAAGFPLDSFIIDDLLEALRHTPAQAEQLAGRMPVAGLFGMWRHRLDDPETFRYGREPDGHPASPWGWDDLAGDDTPAAHRRSQRLTNRMGGIAGSAGRGWDFFVSYTQADRAWAEWIAWVLEEDGYKVLVQAWDFPPGSNWIQRMQDGVAESDRTIAVLSDAYLKSVYGGAEWRAAWAADPDGTAGKLLPVRVSKCDRLGLLAGVVGFDLFGLSEADARKRLRDKVSGARAGRAKPENAPQFPGAARAVPDQPRFPGGLPRAWKVPAHNPNFTGRDRELDDLATALAAGSTVTVQSVHGMGGVGKTQLAVEYAHQHATDYEVVWQVASEEPVSIPGQFTALAATLGLTPRVEPEGLRTQIHDALRGMTGWLLIFDNADKIEDIEPWLPGGPLPPGVRGHVIVTTRRGGFRERGQVMELDVIPLHDAVPLLRTWVPHLDQAVGERIALDLGQLPLALEQAAAYLDRTRIPPEQYAVLLRSRADELLRRGKFSSRGDATVAARWDIHLDRVTDESPEAMQLMEICAYLAPEPIPLDLFTRHPDLLPEPLATAAADQLAFAETIAVPVDYSLAKRTPADIQLHRLVQAAIRTRCDQARPRPLDIALALLHADMPRRDTHAPAEWPRWAALLPHVLAVTGHPQAAGQPQTARLLDALNGTLHESLLSVAAHLNRQAADLRDQGQLEAAHRIRTALALTATNVTQESGDSLVAILLDNAAAMLEDRGMPDDARVLRRLAKANEEVRDPPEVRSRDET